MQYFVAIQTPQHKVDSIDAILKTPLSTDGRTKEAEYLGSVASIQRARGSGVVTHLNIQPVYDIFANVQSRDLGSVAQDIQKIVDDYKGRLKPGNQIIMRGLVESMDTAFLKLGNRFYRRHHPGLFAHGNKFPELDRSFDYYHGATWCCCGHHLDVVFNNHDF